MRLPTAPSPWWNRSEGRQGGSSCSPRTGAAVREVTGGTPSLGQWGLMLAPWGALAALVISAAAALLYVYLVILRRRVALALKLILAFVPVVIVSILFITGRLFEQTFAKVEEETLFRLAVLAQAGSLVVDAAAVDRIRRPPDYDGEDYTKVAGQLKALLNSGDDPWNQRVYANVIKLYNGMFYIMDDNAASYGVLYPVPLGPFDRYAAVLDTGAVQTYEYTDADGTYLEAAAPIRKGKDVIAVLYVGSSKDDLLLLRKVFRSEVSRQTAIVTAVFLAVVAAVSVALLLSINKLRHAVGRMEAGELGTAVRIRGRDEIGELGRGFNSMSGRLKETVTEVTSMKDAYKRFVPQEFLDFLQKERIQDIELGNQVEKDLAVLFCDIRDFTTLSEQMATPADNFRFLNNFLSRMGPVIREAGGFVDKYMGDAIMALFPGGPPDAVRAALGLQRALVTYNGHRAKSGYPPIAIGVGVHAGRMMLGIIGEQERMEGTVIADAVNLASRLEGMTKVYGARIIVSERIVAAMGGAAPDHRYLGHAKVKGKEQAVPVYEIFAADPPGDLRMKRRTKKYFEKGVRLFLKGEPAEALRYFGAVAKAHPGDRAAEYLASLCGVGPGTTRAARMASSG